jgi:hypothetical protein
MVEVNQKGCWFKRKNDNTKSFWYYYSIIMLVDLSILYKK